MDFVLKTDNSSAIGKSKPFTKEETNVLLREAKARKHVICGIKGAPVSVEVRKAWDEIANIVSTIEGITRTANKCKKRYQNVRQAGKKKIAAFKNSRKNVVKMPDSTVTFEDKFVVFDELQGALKEEPEERLPGVDPVSAGDEAERFEEECSVEHSSEVQAAPTSRRSNSSNSLLPEELPFLETQQNGFNMLETELLGVRQSISSLNTRLNRVEVLLRPMGHIADSLGRIATAVELLSTQNLSTKYMQ